MSAILLENLRRDYGAFTAVSALNLSVAPGEIFAFLGANGAGKTTTMKMMVGLLPPTTGRVVIGGSDVWKDPRQAKRAIGYVPDTPILHELLTAREFLWFMADLYGMDREDGRARAGELLELLGLSDAADKLIRDFSLGMKRKMAIANALLHRPRVLLLDEPTNGLDARAAREVKDLVARWAGEGVAVFLTTHILHTAEELAHRIGLIHKGRLICVGTKAELAALAGKPEANLEEIFLTLTGDAVPAEMEEETA
ncbi:MAG TPA: ABC transporter ATP-binding protein [Symbiobacteriaceae bacterium]|nr:ABC transporter ATP-binding protein [Symbiobacteriaceae bacterium]